MPKGIYKHKPHSKETKRKISITKRKNPYHTSNWLGKKHTEVTKKKMSKTATGKNNPMYGVHRFGKNNPNWKGGKIINTHGYILIHKPKHPFSNSRGYVLRSHLVMEKKLGRYLEPEEVVHHKNKIRHDDRLKNLRLFPNKNSHRRFHNLNPSPKQKSS